MRHTLRLGLFFAALLASVPPAVAAPLPQPIPTLRQLGGVPIWVPMCSRRGVTGSAATTESTNTALNDQQACIAPPWGKVAAVRLLYPAFDMPATGEVDRPISATISAAIFQPTLNLISVATSASALSGATQITLNPNGFGGTGITVGSQVVGTNIPSADYITAISYAQGAANTLTSATVTLAAATTGTITSGQTISIYGLLTPVTFAGSRTITLSPRHGVLVSDPVPIQANPGAYFYVRTAANFTGPGIMLSDYPGTGTRIIQNTVGGILYGEFDSRSTSFTDYSMTPANLGWNGGGYWGPVAVLALINPTTPLPGSVLVLGDSIATGTGDVADSQFLKGYIQRSLENTVPFITAARGGTTAQMLAVRGDGQYSLSIEGGITDVLMELGRNDIQQFGSTAASLEGWVSTIAGRYNSAGKRVWCFTIPPTTISNDGFTTQANQSWIVTSNTTNGTTSSGSSSLVLNSVTGIVNGQSVAQPLAYQVTSAAAVAGATSVVLTSVAGLTTGQYVYGPGIALGTTISAINTLTLTLSLPTSGAVAALEQLTFSAGIAPGTTVTNVNGGTKTLTLSTPTIASIASGATIYTGSSAFNTNETNRQTYNSYLRNATNRASLGCYGLVDVDAYMADLGGSYKWRTDLGAASVDGVHPQTNLHQAVVNAGILNASMFVAR
jgi:hypothetical protein